MTVPQQQTFTFAAKKAAGRNVVIEAGAGTGKTTAIVAEALKRLLGPEEIAPERIVLVTFTEKAAGEIGDRIETALHEIKRQLDSGEPVRWPAKSEHPMFEIRPHERASYAAAIERQLPRIDRLRSQTIHSFCQSLLRQFPIEAGIDPQFRVIEGFERSLLYGQIYDDWIDDETRLHPGPRAAEEWEALLDHFSYLFRVQETILLLVDRRHLLLEPDYDIGGIGEYEGTLRQAIDELRSGGDDHRITSYLRASDPPPQGSDIEAWIEFFAPIAIDLRKAKIPDFKHGKEAIKTLRGERGSSVYDLLISHRAAAALLSLTRRFLARLDEEKRTRGVLDFDDLLLSTRTLLRDRAALERIRNQFDCIFVDEFQDTDRVQAEILGALTRDASGSFAAGKTVVVGDPKQSIYAFRRADPETYGTFTSALLQSGAEPRLLLDQYRSAPELVRALNAIGTPLFAAGEKDPNVFRPEYHDLTAARDAPHPPSGHLLPASGEKEFKSPRPAERGEAGPERSEGPGEGPPIHVVACAKGEADAAEREAEAIAQWILARDHAEWKRFAVLFRRRTRLDQYLDVFERHGIPCVVPPVGLFLDRPAAVDLAAVLRAIAYRYDRGAAISAARTPYFALSDAEIVAGLLEPGREPWKSFAESMEGFRRAARHLTVTELIDAIVSATGIEAVYRQAHDGRASLRALEQVRAVAFAYDQNAGGSVRQFVAEVARRRQLPEEVEPSLLDESVDAVRVLTIHGAKGLEFDTVILPDIEFTTHGNGIELFTVEEPKSLVIRNGVDTLSGICRFSDGRALHEIAGLRDDAETRRLFYVAITRAKSDVAIVMQPPKKTITRKGFGKFLIELGIDGTQLPAEPGRVIHEMPIGGHRVPIEFELMEAAPPAEAAARGEEEPLAPCIVPMPAAAVTELSAADIAIARKASGRKLAGILLHRVLERWDGASDVAPLLAALAIEQAADDSTADIVRRRLEVVSRSAMFRRIAAAETVGREMPISFFDDSGVLVDKRIDRLIREAEADLVIDYKSGEATEQRLERDRQQVAEYCLAVEKMTGRRCAGVLWYIDVDNDEIVAI